MNTWGILNRTNNMTRSWFSLFLYICIILAFFYFKESTTVTTDKQRAKRIQQKIYRNVEDKSLPIVSDYVLPIRQSSPFFFFQLVLKLYPHFVFPFTIEGRELPVFFFFFFFSFTEEQKSLLFVFNMDIQILNKYVFRRN